MRKLFLLLCLLICSFSFLYAQEQYKVVNCKSHISIRQTKSTSATVLGTLKLNENVDVYKVEGDWATVKYDGKDAYVLAKYLKYVPPKKISPTDALIDKLVDLYQYTFVLGDTVWALWVILPLLFIAYLFIDSKSEWTPVRLRLYTAVIFLVVVFEFIYTFGYENFIWFLEDPAWYWIAVNFIVFAIFTYYQLKVYMVYSSLVSDNKAKIGHYSIIAAIVAAIILYFMDYPAEWAVVVWIIGQLIVLGMILKTMSSYSNVFEAVLHAVVYIVFTAMTLVVFLQFLVVLIIVLIGYLVLCLFTSSSPSLGVGKSSSSKPELYTNDGAKLEHQLGPDEWLDSYGRHLKEKEGSFGTEFEEID